MDPFLLWIEQGPLTTFLRETNSVFVFPAILVLHAVGMGLLVGTHIVIGLRILGLASQVPIRALASFVPIGWAGLAANLFSGVLLLIAYPTKALTNPLFYVKISLVVLALLVFLKLHKRFFSDDSDSNVAGPAIVRPRDKRWAALLVFSWLATIIAGRFLAYTYTRLTILSVGGF